ncbi:hypothetical protein ABT160_45465 [Streptomyces sp. NPDC001941]|uniref:hypothetical protein n=1 Tax=Streptomyces sp. NPDC001941 TaxID=3154659 RepID=UPI00331E978A
MMNISLKECGRTTSASRPRTRPHHDAQRPRPIVESPVRVCADCVCCVAGLCHSGPSSGCPDALDPRWPYPCPCTDNTMDAPLP